MAIEIDLPESKRGWESMLQDMQGYFTGALKKRAVEISERRLTAAEKEEFDAARTKEIRNFLAAQAFEALPSHLRPDKSQAIGMRWVLTWKPLDDGGRKAKARAVLLGYQDPGYAHRSTTAPVMTRQTRQLFLQAAANRQWVIEKGDITGAFLQGREYAEELFCIPCPEICKAMGLESGAVAKLKKACYGLVDAPLEWYRTISSFFEEIGLERGWADACSWTWRQGGELRGMIAGHVDDFLFGGRADDKGWQEILQKIRERFKWGDWDKNKFVQCGVQIETTSTGYALSQTRYVEGLQDIHLNASRKKERKSEITEHERTKLRALLGGLSWYAQQVAPHVAAPVGLLLSEVSCATVETLVKANTLLQHVRARKDHKMLITRCKDEDMQFFAWTDAASQNRIDGGSTQGLFVGAASKDLLSGKLCPVSPISWHSSRIDRVCRSPGASETIAAVNGEDLLHYVRFQWSEMVFGRPNLRALDEAVARVSGCVITDSRNVYDKLVTEVVSIRGAERRANLELLSLKESQLATGVVVRWVHSEAQIANSLTKSHNNREMEHFYVMNHSWKIVHDEDMLSARKRRGAGLLPLQDVEKGKVSVESLEESS